MEKVVLSSQSYLTFKLDKEIFGSSVSHVLEILEVPKITRVPRSPDYMRGVINLRGSVLPVIDTRIKFGLPPIKDTVNTCIVVLSLKLEGQEITLGALVDAIQEVIEIEEQEIQPPPSIGSSYANGLLTGMVKLNEEFILILNMDQVLSLDEVHQLKDSQNLITSN
jgi:purine-binding chemotaxis protein CheW